VETLVGNATKQGERGKAYTEFLAHCRDRGWITGGDGDGNPYLKKTK
jgi:hypothetical protein